MVGDEMKLAEWLTLDDQTKAVHCRRIASHELPQGQTASYPAQLDVKRRYETGEWSVPCYSLQCLGFNTPLLDALHGAAASAKTSGTVVHPLPPKPICGALTSLLEK